MIERTKDKKMVSKLDFYRVDLSGTDLRYANLWGANLSNVYLSGTDLDGANLSKANLRGANLLKANLYRADLREANLREADLREADLSGADLRGTDLSGADLRGVIYNEYTTWPDDFDVNTLEKKPTCSDRDKQQRTCKMTEDVRETEILRRPISSGDLERYADDLLKKSKLISKVVSPRTMIVVAILPGGFEVYGVAQSVDISKTGNVSGKEICLKRIREQVIRHLAFSGT